MVLLNWDDKLTSKAQVVSLPIITSPSVLPPKPSVTRMPNYIMDVEAVNDLLYVSAIDEEQGSPAKAVVMYLQCDFSDKTPKFVLDSNSGTQPKVVGTVDPLRRPFNHFMTLRFSTSLTRIETLLFCHERPSTHDATGRYPIKFHLVSKTGFFMNTNPTFLMRPIEPQAEIKVLKLGIGSYQSNIAYLINGKLVYIDWINYYSIRFESQNVLEETIKVSEAELVRINVGNYPQCWSFFNANTEIANMAKSAKKGYNLMCLQDSIITMMWAGDSTTYAHVVNIPQTGTIPNYNISTYIPFALSGKTSFENAFTSAVVSTTVMGNLFSPIAYKSGSTPKGNVSTQKNSIDIIEFPSDTIIGGDISYSVFNPHPNMTFFFCKVCDMRFVRDPQDTAPVVIDDVILFANGGIFEDINKHIGYMTCNDQINFTANYLQRNCRVTQSVSTGQWRLAQVLDRTTACQSILIAMESKTNSSRKFYYYDTKSGTIITVGDFANVDKHQMSCTSTRILIVGWKMSSETPSVVELFFNRT